MAAGWVLTWPWIASASTTARSTRRVCGPGRDGVRGLLCRGELLPRPGELLVGHRGVLLDGPQGSVERLARGRRLVDRGAHALDAAGVLVALEGLGGDVGVGDRGVELCRTGVERRGVAHQRRPEVGELAEPREVRGEERGDPGGT
jgi:hypothetical protein